MRLHHALALLLTGFNIALPASSLAAVEVTHAIALRSTPKYPANFTHFDYVNPDAPKGGDVRLEAIGTFDSLNGFIDKGNPAEGLDQIYDTLSVRSLDEPGSYYGLLAEKIERDPADNSWIVYDLNPKAHFSDGVPVTAEDVVFSFDTVRHDGNPFYKMYYQDITKIEELDKYRVKFTFRSKNNPELPIIVGELQILPKHYWAKHNFTSGSLDIPVGSGPFTITKTDPGHSITYTRNPAYWGRDLPVNRGINNFNSETYVYFRDGTVGLQAFKAGQYDFRAENKAKSWAVDYDFPAVKNGYVKKLEQPNQNPTGMQAFVYNLRRPQFQDARVREALGYAYDFEWENKTLFYGAYTRTESYFSNSDLASSGLPSKEELAILEPFRKQLPAEVFTSAYHVPHTDGSGNNRQNLLQAQQLLSQAGWTIKNNVLVDHAGKPLTFEVLLVQPEFERIVQPFLDTLNRLGIQAKLRLIDDSQYIERLKKYDFDMIVGGAPQSLSPGNEQRSFFGSKAADAPNSRNQAGIKNQVVDALIEQLIASPTRNQLVIQARALDRVLLWNYYMIPQYHFGKYRLAYWDFFEKPALPPKYSDGFSTWWINPQKQARIHAMQSSAN